MDINSHLILISFHDLESKIIKSYIRKYCYCDYPVVYNILKQMKLIRSSQHPSKIEIHDNIRSRSALLWCLEKI